MASDGEADDDGLVLNLGGVAGADWGAFARAAPQKPAGPKPARAAGGAVGAAPRLSRPTPASARAPPPDSAESAIAALVRREMARERKRGRTLPLQAGEVDEDGPPREVGNACARDDSADADAARRASGGQAGGKRGREAAAPPEPFPSRKAHKAAARAAVRLAGGAASAAALRQRTEHAAGAALDRVIAALMAGPSGGAEEDDPYAGDEELERWLQEPEPELGVWEPEPTGGRRKKGKKGKDGKPTGPAGAGGSAAAAEGDDADGAAAEGEPGSGIKRVRFAEKPPAPAFAARGGGKAGAAPAANGAAAAGGAPVEKGAADPVAALAVRRAEAAARAAASRAAAAAAPMPAPAQLTLAAAEQIFGKGAATFQGLGLPSELAEHMQTTLGFGAPTQVQRGAIPAMLAGRDVLVAAPTGSGKTHAYLGPIVARLGLEVPRADRAQGTRALILVPTKELALQVESAAKSLAVGPYHWLVPGSVMGGQARHKEKARLRKGIMILVATPGRLLDHLRSTEAFSAARLSHLILDEADRLLDMGFEETLTAILAALAEHAGRSAAAGGGPARTGRGGGSAPWPRQTALLSATLRDGVGRLAALSLKDPVAVGLSKAAARGIRNALAGPAGAVFEPPEEAEEEEEEAEDAVADGTDDDDEDKEEEAPPAKRRAEEPQPEEDDEEVIVEIAGAGSDVDDDSDEEQEERKNEEDDDDDAFDDADFNDAAAAAAGARAGGGVAVAADADEEADDDEGMDASVEVPANLQQHYVEVPSAIRLAALAGLLRSRALRRGAEAGTARKVVVFVSSKDGVEFYSAALTALRDNQGDALVPLPIFKLHGDLPLAARTATFAAFRAASAGALLCTGVAARGLHFPAVGATVLLDAPGEPAEYVHRVGRTARLGQRGESYLFVLPTEAGYLQTLASRGLQLAPARLGPLLDALLTPLDGDGGEEGAGGAGGGRQAPKAGGGRRPPPPQLPPRGGHRGPPELHPGYLAAQRACERTLAADRTLRAAASAAFTAYVRAYAAQPAALKPVLHVRRLHLGHVAKGFGLKEAPGALGRQAAAGEVKAARRKKRYDRSHMRSGKEGE